MDGFPFAVEVVRTDRKRTFSIQVHRELVRARIPRFMSDADLRKAIADKQGWIERKLGELAERPAPKPKEYVDGETFPYLGRDYALKVLRGDADRVDLRDEELRVTVGKARKTSPAEVRRLLFSWYLAQADSLLKKRTAELSKAVGAAPRSVTLKKYVSRWGACSARGDITYNWQIILAPPCVVDYLVVHELCHLLEHNHSPRYWAEVERHLPDWKRHRDWLKHNAVML